MKKCYSFDDQDFHTHLDGPLEDAAESFIDANPDFVGEAEIELFEGDIIERTISRYIPNLSRQITDGAFGDSGESTDNWCDRLEKRSEEIQNLVKETLDKWADENDMQPDFFGIKNVTPFSVKIEVDKDGNWEHI